MLWLGFLSEAVVTRLRKKNAQFRKHPLFLDQSRKRLSQLGIVKSRDQNIMEEQSVRNSPIVNHKANVALRFARGVSKEILTVLLELFEQRGGGLRFP